jgi:PadR family transcriptional regulator, regulatory protein PadR
MPTPRRPKSLRIDVLQGTLDLIILQALRWGPGHGYALVQLISATSRGVLHVDAGSLYPALHRLERQGLIKASWEKSERKQRVRVYRLTRAGTKRLKDERSRWEQFSQAVTGLFDVPAAEGA